MSIKRVLIAAAGRGARLDRPGMPKPLVFVAGLPMIVRTLVQCEEAGIEEAVIVVGYEAPTLVKALTLHPRLTKLKVRFAEAPRWQEEGLVASLLAARPLLQNERFVIAMGDHVFDGKLIERIASERLGDGEVVAMVDANLGDVFDAGAAVKVKQHRGAVLEMGWDVPGFDAVDCGLFACGPEAWGAFEAAYQASPKANIFDAVNRLAPRGLARAVFTDGLPWDDVDTPAALIRTEMRHRKQRREQNVRTITPPEGAASGQRYAFQTGAPATTEVIVGRGIATDGSRLDLGIPARCASSPIFVFTDTTVNRLYGDNFVSALEARGYLVHRIVMEDGEVSKTITNYARLVDHVLEKGIDERSVLVSLGGGAVCNVCGFVASTLYRGIGLIHVPTTLMAQCDAAISHKQALNGARGKNLIGAYYPPMRVVVDVNFLATLEDWLIPDGLAEVVKHALGQDAQYLKDLLAYQGDHRDPDFLEWVVKRNIELKCELMAVDPKEHAAGMVLQYGHNVGHAVEYLSSYDLSHGEAVAIGMMVAARIARLLGGCDDELVELHRQVIAKYNLPTTIPAYMRIPDIIDAMRYDKKFLTEGVRMALVATPGALWQVDGDYAIPVPDDVLVPALEATMEPA
ncbi:MAG: iron-containing alcohol dehydrogenase [Myxococcales bacterium]|nr:iron-containing alcohol dehydrogenase [Myxococcales bacterium]